VDLATLAGLISAFGIILAAIILGGSAGTCFNVPSLRAVPHPHLVFSQASAINLSASGVAFEAQTPLSKGIYLKMELVPYPEHHYIPVYAHIVQCNQLQDDSLAGYHIAVEFKGISDEDDERIINHIFKIQAQEIKREKQNQKTNHDEATDNQISVA